MIKATIELVAKSNAKEILDFEKANRDFFEKSVPSRGDRYYDFNYFMNIIDEIIEEQKQGLSYMYIIRNESGDMVGRVNLFSIVRGILQKAEIGFRIGEMHNRKGYATAAVKLAVDDAFNLYELHRIEAGTSPNNIGSQIALIKNGFQFIGKANEFIKVNNKWEDSVLFEKLNK